MREFKEFVIIMMLFMLATLAILQVDKRSAAIDGYKNIGERVVAAGISTDIDSVGSAIR